MSGHQFLERPILKAEVLRGVIAGSAPAPKADLGSGAKTLTMIDLLSGIIHEDPEGAATWTLPTNALVRSGWPTQPAPPEVGDSIDFYIINEANADEDITMAAGSGGSIVGSTLVMAKQITGEENSGSSHWRLRIASSSAYVCYRLA